ncbi:hypothetical protein Ato02nite_049280 [Paractinoplanes toevensis]|uniref:N-acetylmuramoyl-L-alanine amidase n=2 Tax=Paractinoplanes toevensis TaxID=571911 RepID=A0A919TCP7_9ACTN|nr:hypothetical protein Ato02nite_049280 [Actinoplanes toevensis]
MAFAWTDDAPASSFRDGITALPPDPHPAPPSIAATLTTIDIKAASLSLPEQKTRTFSLLGITWNDPKAAPDGTVQVRTHSVATRKWSGWQVLPVGEGGADSAESSHARGATEPLWVGASDGVAARIVPADGSSPTALPAGLRLDMIDPGRAGGAGGGEPEPSASASVDIPDISDSSEPPAPTTEPTTTAPTTAPTTTAPTIAPTTTAPTTTAPTAAPTTTLPMPTSTAPLVTPLPSYVSRSAWSADETIVTESMSYAAEVRVLFVHHTAETNNYSCADSPAIVRAIQKYHVKSNGWSDIGYNFLVDKCGTLFEGRRGGVTKAVIGAHTYGFNTNSAGIAVLGNYSTTGSPEAAEKTIAQVAAARLGAYNHNPATVGQLTENAPDGKFKQGQVVDFQRISGHRDGVNTECPGNNLYARLPAVRAQAVNMVSGLAALPFGGGGTLVSGVYYARGAVTVNWSVATPSSLLARFEILLDGKVAATAPPTWRASNLPLPAGAHTVAVRAVQLYGATSTTAAAKVFGDVTAPAFPSAPGVLLRGGTYSATYAPVALTYRTADNVRVGSLAVTAPAKAGLSATSTYWNTGVRPGANTTFTLTAKDWAGNARTASVARKAVPVAETAAKRGGTWATRTGGSYLGGKALAATKKNAKLTWTFTGRSAALLFSRAAKTGKADIYLDGKKVATVDTKGSTAYRQGLWVRALTPGKHTVTVTALGTGGRPTVVSDGLFYVP